MEKKINKSKFGTRFHVIITKNWHTIGVNRNGVSGQTWIMGPDMIRANSKNIYRYLCSRVFDIRFSIVWVKILSATHDKYSSSVLLCLSHTWSPQNLLILLFQKKDLLKNNICEKICLYLKEILTYWPQEGIPLFTSFVCHFDWLSFAQVAWN